jgi:hypothetical protein
MNILYCTVPAHSIAEPRHLQLIVEVLVEEGVFLEQQHAEDILRGVHSEAAHAGGGRKVV